MAFAGAAVGAVATIGSSVMQASAQASAARSQAAGVAQTAEQQKINAETQRELDKLDTERRERFIDAVNRQNAQGRRIDAQQTSYNYAKNIQAVQANKQLQIQQIGKELAASETGYQQSLAALDKFRSDLRRANSQQKFQVDSQFQAAKLQARGEFINAKNEAFLNQLGQENQLRGTFLNQLAQYKTARHNLTQQAVGASAEARAGIQEALDQLDNQHVATLAAQEAIVAQQGGQATFSGLSERQNNLAAAAARSAFSNNHAIQQMSDQELETYLGQITIADLTGQMGMTEQELATQLGLTEQLRDDQLTSARTLLDIFSRQAPQLRNNALQLINAQQQLGEASATAQQQQLEAQQRVNRRAAETGRQSARIQARQQRGALRQGREAASFALEQQAFFDNLNSAFAKDALTAQSSASEAASNAAIAQANTQAQAALGSVPSFLSLAGPGIAQGIAGLGAGFLSQPTQPTFQAPVANPITFTTTPPPGATGFPRAPLTN